MTVLCDPAEETSLLTYLPNSDCQVFRAGSFEDAFSVLRTREIGTMIVQYRISRGFSWRTLLDVTSRFRPSPRLIVTDRLADESMWAEALNLGAFDLLPQPFSAREVQHVLRCARDNWEAEWRQLRGGSPAAVA